MTRPAVLIVSQIAEPATDVVVGHLQRQGTRTLRVNCEEAVFSYCWTACLDQQTEEYVISDGTQTLASQEITAVWHRRWGYPIYPHHFEESTIAFCFNEMSALVGGLPFLSTARWTNDIRAERRAANKIGQLSIARELGFRIPKTFVTNDANLIRCISKSEQRTIFKNVSGSTAPYRVHSLEALDVLDRKFPATPKKSSLPFEREVIFTEELDDEKLSRIEDLRWSPAIFQELIEKEADVRVTVIGGRQYCTLIRSQDDPRTALDFRKMNTGINLRHETIKIPPAVTSFIRNLMCRLELQFACLDFAIERKTGEYVFFEANPAGQWLWIEQITGVRISEGLSEHLSEVQ